MTPSPARPPRSWAGSGGGWGRPAATRHPSPARAPRSTASACHRLRGHPPARGAQAIPRVPGCGAAAPKSSLLAARYRRRRVWRREKWRRPRARLHARSTHLQLADKGFPLPPRGMVWPSPPPWPSTAAPARREQRARTRMGARAGGRRLGGLREGYARAGNPRRGRELRAARVPIGRRS